jgi:hypothetical protein
MPKPLIFFRFYVDLENPVKSRKLALDSRHLSGGPTFSWRNKTYEIYLVSSSIFGSCSSITSFPQIDFTTVTDFANAFRNVK